MFEKPRQHLQHPNPNTRQAEHPWEPPVQAKEQALLRVRSHVMKHFETQHQAPSHLTTVEPEFDASFTPVVWKWLAVASTATACLLLLLLTTQQQSVPSTWPVMETRGYAQLEWDKSAQQPILNVTTPPNHNASVAARDRWSMRLQGGTHLAIKRTAEKELNVHLHKGLIQTHVVPGIQQQFVVHCRQQVKVVVKGTRFSVRVGTEWIRVEVSKGKVQVQIRNQPTISLEQGKALRLQLGTLQRQTYSVPVSEQPSSEELFRQLAHDNPKQLLQLAGDVVNQKEWAKHKRRETLEAMAHLLDGQKKYAAASSVWLLLFKMKASGIEGQTSLFHAAQSCRHAQPKSPRCKGLYHRWLRTFPQGLPHFHEECLYWFIRLLRQTNQASPTLQRALQSYQQRYPKGIYLPQIKLWLAP